MRLVLIGAGHSHLEVLRVFGLLRPAGVDITLVDSQRRATYSGMLPGLIAGHYETNQIQIDLDRMCGFAGARFLNTALLEIDPEQCAVTCADGSRAGYDLLSINVGAMPVFPAVNASANLVIPAKPIAELLPAWERLITSVQCGVVKNILFVGGGPAGIELLTAMQYRMDRLTTPGALSFTLVTDAEVLLPRHNARVQSVFRRMLAQHSVRLLFNRRIAQIQPGAAITTQGEHIPGDVFVWATGATVAPTLHAPGLARDPAGFIAVNEHLQSLSHADIYAAGDCASIRGKSYPRSGVYAVRQGPRLADNLRRALVGEPLVAYRPQKRALALISSGSRHAVAAYGPIALSGAWVWKWKDFIDRRFMSKYNVLR